MTAHYKKVGNAKGITGTVNLLMFATLQGLMFAFLRQSHVCGD